MKTRKTWPATLLEHVEDSQSRQYLADVGLPPSTEGWSFEPPATVRRVLVGAEEGVVLGEMSNCFAVLLDRSDGSVFAVSKLVKHDKEPAFANSTIAQFVECVEAYLEFEQQRWQSERLNHQSERLNQQQIDQLVRSTEARMMALDKRAFSSPKCFWPQAVLLMSYDAL